MSFDEASAAELEARLLGGPRRYRREEAAAALGVPVERARRYWRAMGFADVGEAAAFTDGDIEALRCLLRLLDEVGVDEQLGLNLTRALGHHMSRLVTWQVIALVEHLGRRQGLRPEEAARAGTAFAVEHVADFERLLVYAWRRQLAAVTGRTLARGDQEAQRFWLTVGFADMVSFSRLAQRMDEQELAELVSTYEHLASDLVVAGGGRLVKTVGDEVLFVADTAEQGARIGLALAESLAEDTALPDVRVGMATGSVVSRLGDVFGRTVNLASRLTRLAPASRVLVDEETARALAGAPGMFIEPEPARSVRGIGTVRTALLRPRPGEVYIDP